MGLSFKWNLLLTLSLGNKKAGLAKKLTEMKLTLIA
jgi:hypothetical protein